MSEENQKDETQATPEVEETLVTTDPEPAVSEAVVTDTEPTPDVAPEPMVVAASEVAPEVGDVKPENEEASTAAGNAALAGVVATMKKKWYVTLAAVIAGLIVIVGIMYMMEEQGRLNTGLFDGVNRMMAMNKAVATVNDTKISQFDLEISMSQISAGAALQGIDIADPEVKAKIQTQAIEMLVNTELLKQEAATRNIVVTDADVAARLETLKTDVGGEEVLAERMAEFNIDEKTLLRDIRNELTIQALLEQVFEEKGTEVTEKEVKDFYDEAGGSAAGLPPLADVRDQIEQQVRSTKEQDIVTTFVSELKEKAAVEVLI